MAYEIIKNGKPVLHKGKKIFGFDTLQTIKSVNMDKRTMSMIGSTESRDRDGDRIMVDGWDLKHYAKNPVFLWAHDYSSVPLAATSRVVKRKVPTPHLDFQDIRYPKAGIFPFADMILELYNEKIINASSVGFLPFDWEEDEISKDEQAGMMLRPMLYKKQSLLELSGCAVPSNPEALQNALQPIMGKHFGNYQGSDLVKAMIAGSVPSDRQYDDLMNSLNIKQIEVEEETKIQVQVPNSIPHEEIYEEGFGKKSVEYNVKKENDEDVGIEEFETLNFGSLIDKSEVIKPYPGEHACRIKNPDLYDRFRRRNCDRSVDDKCVDVIYGIKVNGNSAKAEVQALRFKKNVWEEAQAKSYCKKNKGSFEAASDKRSLVFEPTIKEMKRWNPSLPKVFDVDQEEFKPASETLELYSKYLDSKIKNIVRRDIAAYGPMVSGYLAAIKTWVEDNFEIKDVRNFTYGGEVPPEYDDIQLTSKDSEEFLIEGTQFLAKDKDIGVVLNTYPIWGGVGFTLFASDKEKSWISSEIKNIHKWVEDNPFLKGEKFALSGKFIDKTEETMDDVVLDKNVRKSLGVSLKIASGGKDSRGIMLVGPPGTGKTMLGKAIKNETNSTFIWISAKDFSRIGATGGLSFAFDLARKLAPTVLFVEDIDGWANGRAVDILKGEMDGLRTMKGVLTILTSNNPTTFPRSLIDRPGRFHDVIVFDNPDRKNREEMIIKWSNGQKISESVMKHLLDKTEGFSGAHIRDLINFAQAIADGEEKGFEEALTESLNKILAQRELIQTLPNYDQLGKSVVTDIVDDYTMNGIKEVLKNSKIDSNKIDPVTQAETNEDEGEDILDHVMSQELPPPAPKKGLNPNSVKELSDTLSKLKTVLKSF